jgi:hypothetical protein
MKKLSIGKNDGIAEVVERVIADEETALILMIPKGCALGTSVSNFHLLRREADAAGKAVAVESVDENVLALAKGAGLEAVHPLFEQGRAGSLSDIRPAADGSQEKEVPAKQRKPAKKEALPAPKILPTELPRIHVVQQQEEEAETESVPLRDEQAFRIPEIRETALISRRTKFIAGGIAVIVVLWGAAWAVNAFWGHATVTINFEKTPWTYDVSAFVADTAVSKVNAEKRILPAERFTTDKNYTKLFPASSFQVVSIKATGKITIYNAYSSQAQSLVATTRFVTPDGKIFRLVNDIVVPGAKITDGKIIPSSVETNVVADKAGAEYNVGPTARLDVPGFKGSPKYDGFYGELKEGTTEGFVGKKPVPTAQDIQVAKDFVSNILKTALTNTSSLLTNLPPDFKILDGATDFAITKLTANENTDAGGNFSVFGEATVVAIGFREADLRELLLSFAAESNPDMEFKELTLNYADPKPDFKNGSESFTVAAEGTLVPEFSADDFKKKILGKSAAEAGSLVKGIVGLSDARVSFWPIWFSTVPSNPDRVKIVVN